MPLSTDLFDFDLPSRLIAQKPADRRDASRLLVVDRQKRSWEHRLFSDLPDYLTPSDTLFRNNAAVLPARLHAQRPTGGAVECFLLRPASGGGDDWWCLLKPGRKLPPGSTFGAPNAFSATVQEKAEDGTYRVLFHPIGAPSITDVALRVGEIPLPPYISRAEASNEVADRERYQTVYANQDKRVAVAAPTAGLHFTAELLQSLKQRGIQTADITLHVGLGTFRPISTDHVEEHAIHRELYEMPAETQRQLFENPGRRIAVGTTTVRTIEDFLSHFAHPSDRPYVAETGIFIYPPRTFRGVDALITNFHQPRSTLLCLVSAFLAPGSTDGIPFLHEIYRDAIAREYRFFSYGDAMLIL